jgi:hypothetical protein
MPDIYMDVDTAIVVPMNKVPITKSSDGFTIEPALVYNFTGLKVVWNFVTSAGAQTAVYIHPTTGGVHDIIEPIADEAMYSIEIPASGGDHANNDTEGYGWISGYATGILPFAGPTIGFRAAALNNALMDGGDTLDVNVETIKDRTITAGANITIRADVGHAGIPGAENGAAYIAAGGAKLAQTVDLTASQKIDLVDAPNATALGAISHDVWSHSLASGHATAGTSGAQLNDIDVEVDRLDKAHVLLYTTIESTNRTTTSCQMVTGSTEADDYIGNIVVLVGDEAGGGHYVARTITDYNPTNNVITWTPALPHDPVDGGNIYIVPGDTKINVTADAIKLETDKIGTPVNTGGTATLGAILGDFANSAAVTRLAAIKTVVDALDTLTKESGPGDLAALLTAALAVKTKTDDLTFVTIGANKRVNAATRAVNQTELTGNGGATPWGPV